jgi:hypothetical protein
MIRKLISVLYISFNLHRLSLKDTTKDFDRTSYSKQDIIRLFSRNTFPFRYDFQNIKEISLRSKMYYYFKQFG